MSIWRRSFPPFSQRPLEINRRSPQARGLVMACPLNGISAYPNGQITPTGADLIATPRGQAYEFASSGDKIDTHYSEHHSSVTVSMWFNLDSFVDNARLVDKRDSGDSEVLLIYLGETGPFIKYICQYTSNRGNWWWDEPENNRPATNDWHHLALVHKSSDTSSAPILYINGVAQAISDTPDSPSGTLSTNTSSYWLGNRGDGTRTMDGRLRDFRLYNMLKSPPEIWQMYTNPHDLYAPPRRWWTSAAVGGYTLTAGQGSYTLTGQDTNFLINRLLTAGQGSYTLTGQDTNFLINRLLTAEQGSYTLTGQDTNFLINRLLTAGQGSYTLTGQDIGLLTSRLLTAINGSYTLAGQDVTLTYSGATYTLTAGQGSYTLTGQDVNLLTARLLTAEQGSYTLTGQDAALLINRLLTAEQGSYTLTGYTVSFDYSGEVRGSVIEISDSAAYAVGLGNSAAYTVVLSDSGAYVVVLSEELI